LAACTGRASQRSSLAAEHRRKTTRVQKSCICERVPLLEAAGAGVPVGVQVVGPPTWGLGTWGLIRIRVGCGTLRMVLTSAHAGSRSVSHAGHQLLRGAEVA
jgi:hypothetical protein